MPRKLFIEGNWSRQSKKAQSILNDAKIQFDVIIAPETYHGRALLVGLAGEYYTPILFADGIMFRGVEGIRDYIT